MINMWDQRFASTTAYVYGTEPNVWIAEQLPKLSADAKVLAVADGEGRNSVWLAKQGYHVLNVDYSQVALDKTTALALDQNVVVETQLSDLITDSLPVATFDALVCSFFHLPRQHQRVVWKKLWQTLKPGAPAIIQVFSVNQLGLPGGGPKDIDLLYDFALFESMVADQEVVYLKEEDTVLNEGLWHQGAAKVINVKLFKR